MPHFPRVTAVIVISSTSAPRAPCWSPGSGRSSTSASTSRPRSVTSVGSAWARRSAASSAAWSRERTAVYLPRQRDPARARRAAGRVCVRCTSVARRDARPPAPDRRCRARGGHEVAPAAQGRGSSSCSPRSPPAHSTTCSRPTSSTAVEGGPVALARVLLHDHERGHRDRAGRAVRAGARAGSACRAASRRCRTS